MANVKKKWVAFVGNSIVPAAVIGGDKDEKQQAGVPVRLPESYADHVVSEQIAEFCDPPKKAPAKSQASSTGPQSDEDKLKAAGHDQ